LSGCAGYPLATSIKYGNIDLEAIHDTAAPPPKQVASVKYPLVLNLELRKKKEYTVITKVIEYKSLPVQRKSYLDDMKANNAANIPPTIGKNCSDLTYGRSLKNVPISKTNRLPRQTPGKNSGINTPNENPPESA
jgi:hypothetical protein